MSVLLVTYDFKNRDDTYFELMRRIKAYNWARLSDSSYAIDTEQSPCEVYTTMKDLVDGGDNLYVTVLTRPYYGFGPEEVNQWLSERLALPHKQRAC
ncbi:hypothetical protein [Marinimicrobium agarilyticum]|uniref:hypothetical protein n=1 Tax=Marinimicrobium agarilyticum TaxID=306546 RepID=UPI0004115051|nr:hypothetical protein [Marinimicrobium agarilyticum]